MILLLLSGLSFAWHRRHSSQHPTVANSGDDPAVSEETAVAPAIELPIPPIHVVVNAYTDLVASSPPDPLMLEDVSELPYPKDLIRLSMQAALKGTLNEKRRADLVECYIMLADYQEGVEVAGPDGGWSGYHEQIVPGVEAPPAVDTPAAPIDLVVEMAEVGESYTSIYQRWESERQQLSADLIELRVH